MHSDGKTVDLAHGLLKAFESRCYISLKKKTVLESLYKQGFYMFLTTLQADGMYQRLHSHICTIIQSRFLLI